MPRPRYSRAVTRPPAGGMNRTEAAYAQRLAVLKAAGEAQAFAFEPMSLRLAARAVYKPDFLVIAKDGTIELHEVKAAKADGSLLWAEAAKVRFKVAVRLFPWFRFRSAALLPKRAGGGWLMDEYAP